MQAWKKISNKFEALNSRERWLVASALIICLGSLMNVLLLSPVLKNIQLARNNIAADQSQVEMLTQQMNELNAVKTKNPDTANEQRIANLQASLQQLEVDLGNTQTALISPARMPNLLSNLLKRNNALNLIALKTLPVQDLLLQEILETDDSKKTTITDSVYPSVFKHGVEITIQGRYLDLLDYVSELERMPMHVLWNKMALNADYPNCQLTLTVYTLSLDQPWLSI
jgi:MSHA biogenesis protein MshJ